MNRDGIWNEQDMFEAEYEIENALGYFRHTEPGKSSMYKRNINRKIIIRGIEFLKENFPDSYMCKEDLSDIDFVMEK